VNHRNAPERFLPKDRTIHRVSTSRSFALDQASTKSLQATNGRQPIGWNREPRVIPLNAETCGMLALLP
jgi:hypothetical protein